MSKGANVHKLTFSAVDPLFSLLRAFTTLFLLFALPSAAFAAYPDRPIRLVVPFAPGGGADAIARLVGQHLPKFLNQPVVVENVPGAGGAIAAEQVGRAAPDGYTLLLGTESTHGTNSVRPLSYDPIRDFAPVTVLLTAPSLLIVPASLPVSTASDLIVYSKQHPDRLNFGSWGSGSSTHLAFEQFKAASGAQIAHIPYKGGAPSMAALVAGEVNVSLQGLTVSMPYLKSNRVKVLAIAGPKRIPLLPDVPTVSESGVPGFSFEAWFAIFAPKGTPQPIVERLHRDILSVLALPEVRERFAALGMEPVGSSPDVLKDTVSSEVTKWTTLVRERNLKFE